MVVVDDYLDCDTRVLAFNRAGQELSSRLNISKQKAFRVRDIEFRVPKTDTIMRYEFQVRPLEAVEFTNVPLDVPTR